MTPLYSPMIAALVTMSVTLLLLMSKTGRRIQDIPNERSLHSAPIPRVGGIGLIVGLLAGWAVTFKLLAWWVVVPLLILFVVSLVDDMRGLTPRLRLMVHFAAAFLLLLGAGLFLRAPLIGVVVLVAVVWMTNLYNFMDGSDGLAGGMAFWGFTTYGAAALIQGSEAQAMLNFSIGGAALGFLYKNFPPAKIFMGDAGSIPLGFLAAAMGLWGWQQMLWPAWFPLMVFSPFWVDATVTLCKRAWRREKLSQAHRQHYYQRLVQMGWGHYKTALAEYALMAMVGLSALWALQRSMNCPWMLVLVWLISYGTLIWAIDSRWKMLQGGQRG